MFKPERRLDVKMGHPLDAPAPPSPAPDTPPDPLFTPESTRHPDMTRPPTQGLGATGLAGNVDQPDLSELRDTTRPPSKTVLCAEHTGDPIAPMDVNPLLDAPRLRLDREQLAPTTVEDALGLTVMRELRSELSTMLVQTDFSAAAVPGQFSARIAATAPRIIEATLAREAGWRSKEYRPLHNQLSAMAIESNAPVAVTLSEACVTDLRTQVETLPYGFNELERYHQVLSGTRIIELLHTIHESSQDPHNPDWLSDAYELVTQAAQNPEDYTVPLDAPESLYLLCFMPSTTRQLVRRLIVNNTIAASVEQRVGPDRDADTETMLTALRQYLNADTLEGQQWTDYAKVHGLAEHHAVAMGMQSVERLAALKTIQTLMREDCGTAVFEAWRATVSDLDDRINEVDSASSLGIWKSVDIGHGFAGFSHDILRETFNMRTSCYAHEYASPLKTGGMAVILEDNNDQRAAWRGVIDTYTVYTTYDDLCFAEPTGVAELADNPEVGLFLIDIQNGDDESAGIRVGTEIFDRLVDRLRKRPGDIADMPVATLRVWSASAAAVEAATAHFGARLESLEEPVRSYLSYWLGGNGRHSSRARIHLEVRLKRWDEQSDVQFGIQEV